MKVVRTVILSLILVFLAFVIYRAAKGGRKIPASTIRAEYRDIESKLTIPGVIQPSKEIDIKSTISGVLEKLLVQVGDEVVGGQPLAQIRYVKDPLEYRRLLKELEIAETRYLTAEASFERTEKLYVKKLIAQEVYEGEKSNLAVLLSEYESVESELDMLKGQYNQKGISNIITATDAGTILELPIKEGGSVMARGTLNEGTTVARVADLQSLVFKGNVLESDILKLAVGMELSLSVPMDKNITIDGVLSLVAPKGIVQDGVARFEITAGLFIPEEYKQMIKAGCTANAEIVVERKNHVLALEEKYFQFNYDSVFVEIVADDSKYEKRFLKTGISDGIYTEIISGVDSLDHIKKAERGNMRTRNTIQRIWIIIIMSFVGIYTYGQDTIQVLQKSCKYTFVIPEGWDTIPRSVLMQKLPGYSIDARLYPLQQQEYFKGNYILINFLPTIKTLNGFPFKQIEEDLVKMNEKSLLPNTDTLRVTYKGTESKKLDGYYHVYTLSSIVKDSVALECVQDLLLTKFGYVSLSGYQKEGGKYALSELLDLMTRNIQIQQPYKYVESASKQHITCVQMIVSVCIGLLAYIIIILFSKRKKNKK